MELFYDCSFLKSAFSYLNIKKVILGNCITSIDERAFYGCTALDSIFIPDSVTSIGKRAFEGYNVLKLLNIGNNVDFIGDSAFSDCVDLSKVTIPNEVNMIYWSAFSNCENLSNISILGNLDCVGQGAFADCIKLNNFTYKGTKSPRYDEKEKYVFSNCLYLDKVSVPKNYEGNTFCGHKTTKGKSPKERFEENIGWGLSGTSLVVGIVTGIIGAIVTSIKFPSVVNIEIGG